MLVKWLFNQHLMLFLTWHVKVQREWDMLLLLWQPETSPDSDKCPVGAKTVRIRDNVYSHPSHYINIFEGSGRNCRLDKWQGTINSVQIITWNCKFCKKCGISGSQWKWCWWVAGTTAKPLTNEKSRSENRKSTKLRIERALRNRMIWISKD